MNRMGISAHRLRTSAAAKIPFMPGIANSITIMSARLEAYVIVYTNGIYLVGACLMLSLGVVAMQRKRIHNGMATTLRSSP